MRMKLEKCLDYVSRRKITRISKLCTSTYILFKLHGDTRGTVGNVFIFFIRKNFNSSKAVNKIHLNTFI
jgi:hypothetical protein